MQQRSVSASLCVGREAELARLADLYREANQHGERFVLVEGPSGAGKSRLLAEFRSRARLDGAPVLEGRCEPGRPFGPFAEIVERGLRFLEEVGARPSVDLADLACSGACHRFWYQHGDQDSVSAPESAPQRYLTAGTREVEALERRLRFFEALLGLLRDVAAVRPPLVVLHDLERADQGTLQVLRFILDAAGPWTEGVTQERSLRALFVASVRLDELTSSVEAVGAEHSRADNMAAIRDHRITDILEVGKLDEEGVRAYLQSPETVARVLARTGGLPDAIDLLLEADPLTPEARLSRRLAALPAQARDLMDGLAVVGHPADLDLLATVAAVKLDTGSRSAFSDSELVSRTVVDGRILFTFARDSSRELSYELLSPERRQRLHAQCVDLFVEEKVELAALHALRANDVERAVPLAFDAARSLAARHAHSEAAALLEQVVEADPDGAPTPLREYLADLYRVAGDYRSALAHANSVHEQNPECPEAARRVGDLLTLAGRLDDATATLEDAQRLAIAREDRRGRAEVEALLAELHYQRASYEQARQWAETALETALALDALPLGVHARNTLGKLALAQKDAHTAVELFETNRRLAETGGLGHQEAQALTNLGVAMLRKQELAAAEEAFGRAIEVAERASDTRDRAIATENLAVLAHLRRDYGQALGFYQEAVALLKRLGNRAMLARVANNLGELYLSLGERGRARTLCEYASHVGGTGLPPSVTGEGLMLRGRVEVADSNGNAAKASFEAALRTFQRLGEARVADASLELARLALADGNVAVARRVLTTLPVQESPKRAAEVALVAVDIERAAGGETLAAARRATALANTASDAEVLLPALIRLVCAECDAGDVEAASQALDQAHDIEGRLTETVPEEAAGAWASRPTRAELARAESQLAAIWGPTKGGSWRPRRASSTPPPADTKRRATRLRRKFPHIVGSSPPTLGLLALLEKVAPTDALALIRGESGTGKELVAEALHRGSPRRDRPLIKVNCAALVETLLLSELFGHERGAFTGANSRKKGRFELADGGTLFLDEIGDISPKTQVALLRVLQEREFERVGGTQAIKVDVRIIAATHRDLEQMVQDGTFREDLYYRLRGVMIEVPALRRRPADLPELCNHLLSRLAQERQDAPKRVNAAALDLLARHSWPGNVRELENVLRSATLFAETEELVPQDFAAFADSFTANSNDVGEHLTLDSLGTPRVPTVPLTPVELEEMVYERVRGGESSLFEMKKVIERECIVRALSETSGNITQAATLLGMKRPRLSQLVKQYGLAPTAEQAR